MARKRTGAYRKSFFNSQKMAEFWLDHIDRIESFKKNYKNNHWSEAELVAATLSEIWHWAKGPLWLNGQIPNFLSKINSHKISENSPLYLWQNNLLRGIPLVTNKILLEWHFNRSLLQLFFTIPTEMEVLKLQCKGTRCVSLLISDAATFSTGGDDRDSFSFTLHDLIHASHFFKSEEHKKSQIFFALFMQAVLDSPKVQQLVLQNLVLRNELYYISSDMNTHWIHSLKCLKSSLARVSVDINPILHAFLLQLTHANQTEFKGKYSSDYSQLLADCSSLNSPAENSTLHQSIHTRLSKYLDLCQF